MGQLANPIGFRIGRGRGNYVWSKNASFFYNRPSYKRIMILFRYLSLLVKKFGAFLRRLYRRPLFTARPTYNLVGFGPSRTLILGLSIFDYFSALRRMPARAWSRYPRTPRWGRLKPRELRRFVRFRRNRRKGKRK